MQTSGLDLGPNLRSLAWLSASRASVELQFWLESFWGSAVLFSGCFFQLESRGEQRPLALASTFSWDPWWAHTPGEPHEGTTDHEEWIGQQDRKTPPPLSSCALLQCLSL